MRRTETQTAVVTMPGKPPHVEAPAVSLTLPDGFEGVIVFGGQAVHPDFPLRSVNLIIGFGPDQSASRGVFLTPEDALRVAAMLTKAAAADHISQAMSGQAGQA